MLNEKNKQDAQELTAPRHTNRRKIWRAQANAKVNEHMHKHAVPKMGPILITPNHCVTFWHLNAIKICMWKRNQVKSYST